MLVHEKVGLVIDDDGLPGFPGRGIERKRLIAQRLALLLPLLGAFDFFFGTTHAVRAAKERAAFARRALCCCLKCHETSKVFCAMPRQVRLPTKSSTQVRHD